MALIRIDYFTSPIGELKLGSIDDQLCICDWRYRSKREEVDQRVARSLNAEMKEESSEIIENCKSQLEAYFKKERNSFDLPLLFAGSDFQQRVWRKLLEIPYGKTMSYLELSRQLGDEKAIRAVASANGANAISIIVPCHRIIGSNGELTGYAGGLTAKRKLLELENENQLSQLELF